MELNKYLKLLPGTRGFKQLVEWLRYCAPPELKWDLQFILKSKDADSINDGTRLGYSTWLLTEEPDTDINDLIIEEPELKCG